MKRRDEERQFEEEIISLYEDIFRYLLYLGCQHSLARDLAQITMEKAWRNRKKILQSTRKAPWLFRVAHNEYITVLRRTAKQYQYDDMDNILMDAEIDRITGDVSDILVQNEDLKLLHMALERLEPKYAVPVRLRFFGELSHKEIADILGLNYNTTRSVIARGLNKLRDIFLELGE